MEMEAETVQKFQGLLNEYLESLQGTLGEIINSEVKVELSQLDQFSTEGFKSHLADEVVRIKITPAEGLEGDFILFWETALSAKVADLMLMGDGGAEFNAEEHLEPLREAFAQLFGPIATDLSQRLDRKVEFSGATIELVNRDEAVGELAEHYTAVINSSIADFESVWTMSFLQEAVAELAESTTTEGESVDLNAEVGEPITAEKVEFEPFSSDTIGIPSKKENLDLLMDLHLNVSIELGRTSLFIRDILELVQGSVIELDKLSGDPVDIFVNRKKFAEGEVVVVDENFGVRITDVISSHERVSRLGV